MIQISSLNKVYKSKKRKKCKALDDINLTLEDNGLVFVLGKSGSGKSTLLNLIGGLDSITSGKVVVDGNNISNFKEKDFCDYRNTHIGFIFQDYHLIDELTVYDNIALSLNLCQIDDKERVKNALAKVDLAGYEDRYPTELSGGQQQRVAIARAIVKNPRIILADEPTGNLDTNTARSIIELLKQLSKDCLILIVSHNINDANNYADRIIELSGGKIISDRTKNPKFHDEITIENNSLVYPENTVLSDNDISLINENKCLKLVKQSDKFINTVPKKLKPKRIYIVNNGLRFTKELILGGKFLKNKALAITLSSFMVAVIMVIMSLAQTIISFDAEKIIADEMKNNNQDSMLLNKLVDQQTQSRLDGNYRSEIIDGDIEAFYDLGYEGKIYPVVNVTLPITSAKNVMGIKTSIFTKGVYISESLGTIVVDEQFLEEKFGEVKYLAKLENPTPSGLIITDYIADSILATNKNYKGKTYKDILGECKPNGWNYDSVNINAIIYTGYSTKYQSLLEKVKKGTYKTTKEYYEDKDFLSLSNEIYSSLGYTFSLDADFINKAYETRDFGSHGKLIINDSIEFTDTTSPYISFQSAKTCKYLSENNLVMSYTKYNEIFGTSYNLSNLDTFEPHTIKITSYRYYDVDNKNPIYSVELTIEGLTSANDTFIIEESVHSDLKKTMLGGDSYYHSLYFSGIDGISSVLDNATELNYEPQSYSIEGVHTMTRAVEVFIPMFELIGTILSIGVIFILVNFASKMINDKMHEIGILKALGTKNTTICVVFGMQVLFIGLLTCLMMTLGYYLFIDLANDVLIESLMRLAPKRIVLDLNFLVYNPKIAFENCIMIIILASFSLLIPLIRIKKIKPVKIIQSKD